MYILYRICLSIVATCTIKYISNVTVPLSEYIYRDSGIHIVLSCYVHAAIVETLGMGKIPYACLLIKLLLFSSQVGISQQPVDWSIRLVEVADKARSMRNPRTYPYGSDSKDKVNERIYFLCVRASI